MSIAQLSISIGFFIGAIATRLPQKVAILSFLTGFLLILLVTLYLLIKLGCQKSKQNNVIAIKDKSISRDVFFAFHKQLLDIDESTNDIDIVIRSGGGEIHSIMGICKLIAKARNTTRKINCYVLDYAYSGAFIIALACDNIYVVGHHVTFGPMDSMHVNVENLSARISHRDIKDTLKYSEEKKLPLSDPLLLEKIARSRYDADNREIFSLATTHHNYSKKTLKKIHKELFSGKHEHDKIFFLDDIESIGVLFEVIDELPSTFIHTE